MNARPAIRLIAALDRQRAIGRDNAMPWHLPDDLKRFKALTLGKPVLMGRKTAQSLGRALPGRRNLVLTRRTTAPFAGMQPVASLDDALAQAADAAELWVIGGGEVYARTIDLAHSLHLTHVDCRIDHADAWFPAFDPRQWRVSEPRHHPPDARHASGFDFVDYHRAEHGTR